MSDEWDMDLFFNCDECPWPGKCSADCCCWLDVEWQEDKPETEEAEAKDAGTSLEQQAGGIRP